MTNEVYQDREIERMSRDIDNIKQSVAEIMAALKELDRIIDRLEKHSHQLQTHNLKLSELENLKEWKSEVNEELKNVSSKQVEMGNKLYLLLIGASTLVALGLDYIKSKLGIA